VNEKYTRVNPVLPKNWPLFLSLWSVYEFRLISIRRRFSKTLSRCIQVEAVFYGTDFQVMKPSKPNQI
jgi:hypothetical protein